MLSESYQSTVVTQINNDITAINKAMLRHTKWLAEWNKILVCGQAISEPFIQPDAYKHCGFGIWYYGEHSPFTLQQDEFPRLEQLHKRLHDSVAQIMNKANNQERLTTEDYDDVIAKEVDFSFSLIALRDSLFGQLYSFDYLTGVFNRQAFYSLLEKEFARVERTSNCSSIVMVDLDYFKKVNDQYGHQVGDKVLTYFATYIKKSLRPYDSVGRYGGEEFLICLPDTTITDAKTIMERIREDLANQVIEIKEPDKRTLTLSITASFGISSLCKGHPISEAIETADMAMYEAKTAGRNKVKTHHYEAVAT
ncbi:diguanylate cyclase [Alkalimarinus coralli]|uniref:diguanylate cyclase n=1 Tax=Alkalimarinus coralli TaxID=2935863 RepID=UPI00202BA012|nr:diguanylate cyclase [Alkalimarinus coralli]